jgi:CRP-like cAMP-binding protein
MAEQETGMRSECVECPVLKGLLFRGLSDEQITRLGCIFRPARYRRNQILFFEGGTAQHIFALHTGLVKIAKSLENGKERITRVLFPGELFGIEALVEPLYPLTAVTLRDCEICAADREEFTGFLRNNSDVSLGMVRFLVSEISRVRSQVTDMSFKDARMKVATFLLSLIDSDPQTPTYPYALNLPFSRQEISEILELSPETVSRTLGQLRRNRTIEARGRRVTIHDPEALRAAAHR